MWESLRSSLEVIMYGVAGWVKINISLEIDL
jgi:hypothetical protein